MKVFDIDRRDLDKALFAYGRFLKSDFASVRQSVAADRREDAAPAER